MKKKFAFFITFLLLFALAACGSKDEKAKEDSETASVKKWDNPPEMKIDKTKNYIATISTNKGDIKIELFASDAPLTVNNFVFLAKEKFYENIIFHRVIKGFMIQTGDPEGTGAGGPGYSFEDELPSPHRYEEGIVAMANAGPDTNGSQFFICNGPDSEGLNSQPNYTIFGKVIEGMDTVKAISDVEVKQGASGEVSEPTEKIYIKKVTISE